MKKLNLTLSRSPHVFSLKLEDKFIYYFTLEDKYRLGFLIIGKLNKTQTILRGFCKMHEDNKQLKK